MQPCLPGENIAILEVPQNGRGLLLLLFKLLLAPTWAPHSAHFSFYEFVAPIYIWGSSWGHIGNIFVSPPRQFFLSNLKYVANYMPSALKFLCFFLRCFLLWFVQGDNVLLPIPFVHVKEGGGGTKEASHNRSNHCNRLQGGECFLYFLSLSK